MTLTARLEAAADICEAVGNINAPVPVPILRMLIELLKEKEAKK